MANGTCQHADVDFDFPTGSITSPSLHTVWCGAPADPRSNPDDPRCTKHLNEEE